MASPPSMEHPKVSNVISSPFPISLLRLFEDQFDVTPHTTISKVSTSFLHAAQNLPY